jgi:hypothetical protein
VGARADADAAIGDAATVTVAAPSSGAAVVVDHATVDASAIPLVYLGAARSLDVLFGHQSVGLDIMTGLGTLAGQNATRYGITMAGNGLPYPPYADPPASWFSANDGIGGREIGTNGDPGSKTRAFDGLVRGAYGPMIDVALMKFCFTETYAENRGQPIWDLYRTAMQQLILDFPNVKFVWTTMPLAFIGNQPDPNDYGLPAYEFNDLVRAHVAANGGYLLDIADIESHDAGGSQVLGPQGRPNLAAAWALAADDPHLGAAGQARMAQAWWHLMARVAGWTP